jgi:hypothetical protein
MEVGEEKDSFKILVLSQIGGATKYKSEDNLIGLAHYLDSLSEDSKPDFSIFIGGLIPEIPRKGSKGNFNKLLAIENGIANIYDAAAVIKPHMERILKGLPASSRVVYAFGEEDFENIRNIEESLIYDYNYNPEGIAKRIKVFDEGISSREEIIKSTIESRKALKAQLKNATKEEKLNLLKELANIEVKLKINNEEKEEFKRIKGLLSNLYTASIMKTDQNIVEKALKETKERLKEVKKEMKRLKGEGASIEEYNKLKREAKLISDKIRALNHRLNESAENASKEDFSKKEAQALIFTKQIPISKSAAELIHNIVIEQYKSVIKDALGRKRDVEIQINRIGAYKASGYDVIIESPKGVYTQKGTNDYASMLYKGIENGMLNVGSKVLYIRGRSLYTEFKLMPLFNNTDTMLAILNQGPFLDLEKKAMVYNLNINTNETKAIDKALLSSGLSIVTISNQSNQTPKFEYIDAEMLRQERLKSDIEEKARLEELLNMLEAKNFQKNGSEAFKPELERAILSNKRPSEIKERELNYADKGLLLSLLRADAKEADAKEEKPIVIKVASLQDIHIGNHTEMSVFEAALEDIAERKPDILLLLGDILEGNLNNYKNVPRQSNRVEDASMFKKFVERIVGKEKAKDLLIEYYEEKEKSSIYNIDEQAGILITPMLPIIIEIIKRNGYILIASGNHYNKSEKNWQFDEASRIKDYIKSALSVVKKELPEDWEEHIKVAPGSEYGAESFFINYKGKEYEIDITHTMPIDTKLSSSLIRERSNSKVFFCGHYHKPEVVVLNGRVVIYGASMQKSSDNPFLKRIRAAVSESDLFTGYTYSELLLEEGKVANAKIENVLKPDLLQKMEQIKAEKSELYKLYMHHNKSIYIK